MLMIVIYTILCTITIDLVCAVGICELFCNLHGMSEMQTRTGKLRDHSATLQLEKGAISSLEPWRFNVYMDPSGIVFK